MSKTIVAGTSITFSYTYDELFDVVSLKTSDIAVSLKDNEGDSMLDDFGITEDEQYTVIQKMQDGANEIFNKLLKITNGLADSIQISATNVSCAIKDKEAYNMNVVDAIDRTMKNALINYIIMDWFREKNLQDFATIFERKYRLNVREIEKMSVQLRKPTIS